MVLFWPICQVGDGRKENFMDFSQAGDGRGKRIFLKNYFLNEFDAYVNSSHHPDMQTLYMQDKIAFLMEKWRNKGYF